MVTKSQATHVMALVRERHDAVKQAFERLLNGYAIGERSQIIAANDGLRTALHQLQAVVAAEHWPAWLQDLTAHSDQYATRHNNGLPTWRAHLNSALKNANRLNTEDWAFSEKEDVLFDIDGIVNKARQDQNVDGLYGRVIECLEALLNSGEIDSIKASADLTRLIATLQKAREGSFSSQVFSWQFARRLIPNIITAYVRRSDITGPLVEAFEQTASELDVSLDAAKDQIGEGILSAAADALRTNTSVGITHESILFLEHQPSGGSVIDADRAAE